MSLRKFLDNARREASSLAHGFFPGMQAIGQAVVNDADTLIFEKGLGMESRRPRGAVGGTYGLDDVARAGYQGFIRETPILPLLRGDIREAGQRIYERPISGTLDVIGLGAGVGQGLKTASRIPGTLGQSALKARGFREFDPAQFGTAINPHQMPAKMTLADGSVVPSREYLLRPQLEYHGGKAYAKRTMRSPRPSGNETFDAALDKGTTLADDPLVSQSVPRARFEPFALMGDAMNFGPKLGSARFGKRIAIRSQSRLRTSVNEMMASHGRVRKLWEKKWGKDAGKDVGDAQLVAAAGFKDWESLIKGLDAFQDSGRQAIIGERGVDLAGTTGKRFNLNKAEFGFADALERGVNKLAEELAEDIAKLNEHGYKVVLTGGKSPLSLSPDAVRARPQDLYELLASGNLHIRRLDQTVEPKAPMQQGQLFGDKPYVGESQHPIDVLERTPAENRVPRVKDGDFELYERPRTPDPEDIAENPELFDLGELSDKDFEELHIQAAEDFAMSHGERSPDELAELASPGDGTRTFEILHPETGERVGTAEYHVVTDWAQDPKTGRWGDVAGPQGPFYKSHKTGDPYIYISHVNIDKEWRGQGAGRSFYRHIQDQDMPVYRNFVNKELAEHQEKYRIFENALDEKFPNEHRYRSNRKSIAPETEQMFDDSDFIGKKDLPPPRTDTPEADQPPTPPTEPRSNTGEPAPIEWNKKLRAKVAGNYSQAQWYKNALDNLVKARLDPDAPDITQRMAEIAANPKVREIFESAEFRDEILPQHKAMVAAQLEASKVQLGANALSNDNVVRNSQRLAMIFGNDDGHFFVARPRRTPKEAPDRIEGTRNLELIDENNPGDPFELIARGELDTSPEVHLNNYLKRRNEAANQELTDAAVEASINITPQQHKAYLREGVAIDEPTLNQAGKISADFVVIRPGGRLFEQIENMQPLAAQTARRLREEGLHEQAANIRTSAKEMFENAADGDFSLGDMIRNPKLRGEIEDSRYMIPTDMYQALINETSNATYALSSFLQATSTGFKISVLHGRWPAWVVNNTIGAQLYLALTGGTGKMIPHTGGRRLVREVFPDVVGSGSREMALGADDLGRVATSRKDKLLASKPGRAGKNIVDTLTDWNQKIADEPARLDRLEQVVEERFQSTVELAKARGIEIPDTLESRRKMLQDIHVREDIAREVLDDMIDFTSMSRRERMWVASMVPFWTFIKGSTKSTQRLLADHPGRVWAPMEVAAMGSEYTDQAYPGGIPDYLRALLPVGGNQALTVGGWNPYGQQAQMLTGALGSMNAQRPTGQEHPFAMLNPALTIPVESISNREFYTDYPMTGNVLKNAYEQTMENVPLAQTFLGAISPKQITGREAYIPSRRNTLLNFMGVPVREVNHKNMNVRMRTDENRRKKNGEYDYWEFHGGV